MKQKLTKKQLEVLQILQDEGPLTAYSLGAPLGIGNTAAKARCDPLKERGLVETTETVEKGNFKRYYAITEKGIRIAKENLEDELERTRAALEAFKDEEDTG